MKKDRNCNMSVYPGVMPGFGGMVYPGQMVQMPGVMTSNISDFDGYNDINSRIASLEQRISKLENMISGSNYNSSNYQMM